MAMNGGEAEEDVLLIQGNQARAQARILGGEERLERGGQRGQPGKGAPGRGARACSIRAHTRGRSRRGEAGAGS